jgi:hypothetical protein
MLVWVPLGRSIPTPNLNGRGTRDTGLQDCHEAAGT